jgi:methionine-rich copper-binding protein CopC
MKTTILTIGVLTSLLAACGGGGSSSAAQDTTPPPPARYSVTGSVSGLAGTLVLRVNDATDVTVSANGAVLLANALADGASYSIAVKTQPSNPTQHCELGNATGKIASANVTNITATCAAVPLTLASSTPASGATGAARDAPVTLTFSTTIDASAASVVLHGPAGDVSTTQQVSGAQLIVTPATQLARLGAYTLTVDGIRGTGGELLGAPVTLGFESADGAWSTPVPLETATGDVAFARIAMDASGNALAVWVQASGGGSDLVANRWKAGTGWEGSSAIAHDSFGATTLPEVRFDHDGNALALWLQLSGSALTTWASRFSAVGTWGAAEQISGGRSDAEAPAFDFDATGGALALWANSSLYTADAYRFTRQSGWIGAAFPPSNQYMRNPQVCFESTGRAQVIWTVLTATTEQVRANTYVAGTWGSTAVLDEVNGHVRSLHVVCPASGAAQAAWLGEQNGVYHVHASTFTADGWTAPSTLDPGATDANELALAADAAGNTIVVWSEGDAAMAQLRSRRFGANHVWSAAQRIDDPAAGSPSEPELALDAHGNGWALWRVAQAGKHHISASRLRDGEFATPVLIDPERSVDASSARVALDPSGNALAIWLECPTTTCNVVASRFE